MIFPQNVNALSKINWFDEVVQILGAACGWHGEVEVCARKYVLVHEDCMCCVVVCVSLLWWFGELFCGSVCFRWEFCQLTDYCTLNYQFSVLFGHNSAILLSTPAWCPNNLLP